MPFTPPWLDYFRKRELINRPSYVVTVDPGSGGGGGSGSALPAGQLLAERLGQSNNLGHSSAATLTDQTLNAPNPNVNMLLQAGVAGDPIGWRYFPGSNNTTPPSTYYPVQSHFFPSVFSDCMSHDLSLARSLNNALPNRWALVTCGVDGTGLNDYWIPTATLPVSGGNLYNQSKTLTQTAVSGKTLVASIFAGCEADCQTGQTAKCNAIPANLAALFSQRRTDLGDMPVFIVGLNPNITDATYPNIALGITGQKAAAASIRWCTFVDNSTGVVFDTLHNNADTNDNLGQAISAAIIAAWNLTTMSATIVDSVDPLVADGRPYSYTVQVNNLGSQNAKNPSVVVTVDPAATFVNAAGTGWTFSNVGNVVTCTMVTMVPGAASPITINCNAPSAFGSGSISTSLTLVANNVRELNTASQGTTLTAPAVTKDSTSNVFLQQNASEFSSFISAQGLTGQVAIPDAMWAFTITSGNISDLINSFLLTAAGTNGLYDQAQTGWTTHFFKTINAATAKFTNADAGLPDLSTTSLAMAIICEFSAAPSSTRGVMGAGTASNQIQVQMNNTPRLIGADGSNTVTGTVSPISTADILLFVHNVTTPTACCMSNKNEDQTLSKGTGSGKTIQFFGTAPVGSDPPMGIVQAFMWKGANAELLSTQSNRRNWINKQANGNFTVPW